VRANRAYELIVTREGFEPAFLADPHRRDRIELVSIDDGEVILYWELPVKEAARLIRELKADLAQLTADDFMARWEGQDTGADS
jgi:hypothetical protein